MDNTTYINPSTPQNTIVRCNTHEHRWSHKPKGYEVSIVQEELTRPCDIDVRELADMLVHGCNCRVCAVTGKKDEGFESSQMIGIDIDNTDKNHDPLPENEALTIDKALQICSDNGLFLTFAYETASSRPGNLRFRMVFLLDEIVTDKDQWKYMTTKVIDIFSPYSDVSCKNPARLFFGSNTGALLYENFNGVSSVQELMTGYAEMLEMAMNVATGRRRTNQKRKKAMPLPTDSQASENESQDNSSSGLKIPNVNEMLVALKSRNIRYLREHVTTVDAELASQEEFVHFINYDLDLAELLGVETNPFSCVFHDDHNASASVFRTGNNRGVTVYKCHADCLGNGSVLSVTEVVSKLTGLKLFRETYIFIKKIYGITIKTTDWSVQQKDNIQLIRNEIQRDKYGNSQFSIDCPDAAKVLKHAMCIYMVMLWIAEQAIYPEKELNGNVIFYASVRQIAEMVRKKNISVVQRYIKALAYFGLLRILDDSEVPKSFLNAAVSTRIRKGRNQRVAFYEIPVWDFDTIRQRSISWKENHYRIGGMSYEMLVRGDGYDVAAEVFPQFKNKTNEHTGEIVQRKPTARSNRITERLTDKIIGQIQQKGYCLLAEMHTTWGEKEQLLKSLGEILTSNNLTRVRCNKQLKERYDIESKGYPMIIIPK